jgi:hypothetical protein
MKKMFHLLENVNNFNSFLEVPQFEHVNGNQQDLYIRIVQKSANSNAESADLRWLPSGSATLTFKFDSLDKALVISRVGTMAFPSDDRSVWKVTLLPGDVINGSMSATLTDGGITETLLLDGRLIASGADSERFFC